MKPTNEELDDLMREAALEAIAEKDYRDGQEQPMTEAERDRYDAVLYFARLVLERFGTTKSEADHA